MSTQLTVLLTISYVGTRYHGWQVQPGVPTVQGIIQDAVTRLLKSPHAVFGCSRTDAGVHARRYLAAVVIDREYPESAFLAGLNTLLPPDIVVHDVHCIRGQHNPRDLVARKTYHYYILEAPCVPAFAAPYMWYRRRPLHLQAMHEAAAQLLGEYDCRGFIAAEQCEHPMVCRIESVQITRSTLGAWWPGIAADTQTPLLTFAVTADRFGKYMVRTMVGTLMHMGEGRRHPNEMLTIMQSCDRTLAGPVVPAHGLWLHDFAMQT